MITPNNSTARVPGPLRSSSAVAGRLPGPMGLNLDPINWMRGHLTLKITLDMPVPATDPAPDYSKDEQHLRAWERADFSPHVRAFAICDRVMIKGIESSFVKEIQFTFIQSNFQYFVAKHIYENKEDQTKTTGERVIWRKVNAAIMNHAREHFNRYRQVVAAMKQEFTQIFQGLPGPTNMIQLPQQQLETYVNSLLDYLAASLDHELWKKTCEWEHKDYPTLLKGTGIQLSAPLKPACDPEPSVPKKPTLPIIVKAGKATSKTVP
jgi:hypothetical protein